MLDTAQSLPEDPDDLRRFTTLLLAEVRSQAMLIHCPAGYCAAMPERGEAPAPARMRHCLSDQWRDKAHHRNSRFGTSSETIEQLQLALETTEIPIAKMTATLRLPDEEKDKPKRRPIPDHIPRQQIEITTGDDDCAQCGGTLRRLDEEIPVPTLLRPLAEYEAAAGGAW